MPRLILVSLLALALSAPAAQATTVAWSAGEADEGVVVVTGEPGEANDVSVTRSRRGVHVLDVGAPARPGEGCEQAADGGVRCPAAPRVAARLGDRDDALYGTDGPDEVHGGAGDDTIHAGGGRDEITGGRGDDELAGGVGRDVVHGGPGRDRIEDFYGVDRLFGDGGNDVIDAIDGLPDRISCGGGRRDRVLADRRDRRIAGCERIRRGEPVSEGNVPA